MNPGEEPFHPDLRGIARWMPRFTFSRPLTRVMRLLMHALPPFRPPNGVRVEDVRIPVRVRTYRPVEARPPLPVAARWQPGADDRRHLPQAGG